MTEPRPEAVAAANWWADLLAHQPPAHDIGDEGENAFLAAAMSVRPGRTYTPEQIADFRRHLADVLEKHVDETWRPELPQFGSMLRCVMVDYGPDPELVDAAKLAGFKLDMLDLPMKTYSWINPGKVTVRLHGQDSVIWEAP